MRCQAFKSETNGVATSGPFVMGEKRMRNNWPVSPRILQTDQSPLFCDTTPFTAILWPLRGNVEVVVTVICNRWLASSRTAGYELRDYPPPIP